MPHGYKASRKKPSASLVGMTIRCETLDREVTVQAHDLSFSASSGECDLCGSHGDVTVEVRCECGSRHEIELDSW